MLVNARLAVIGKLPASPEEPRLAPKADAAALRLQRVYIGGWRDVPVYDFESLAPGQSIAGPALIESPTTTVLIEAGDRATATPIGWLDVAVD